MIDIPIPKIKVNAASAENNLKLFIQRFYLWHCNSDQLFQNQYTCDLNPGSLTCAFWSQQVFWYCT